MDWCIFPKNSFIFLVNLFVVSPLIVAHKRCCSICKRNEIVCNHQTVFRSTTSSQSVAVLYCTAQKYHSPTVLNGAEFQATDGLVISIKKCSLQYLPAQCDQVSNQALVLDTTPYLAMQIKDLARDELGTPGLNAYNLIFDMNTQLRVHNQKSASIQRKMATLVCNCGAGCLYFPDDPILRLVCCCADCRTCLALLDAAAGHLPRAAAPIDAVYYPNRLRVERAPTSARAFFCQQQVRRFVSSQGVNPSLHPSPPSLAPSCTDTYTAGAVTPHCPCLHSLTHSLTHTQTHTTGAATPQCSLLSHAYTQTRTHTCTIIHTHAHTHTHTHTLVTHTRTHTRTHTVCLSTTPTQHAHTHTHTHCRCCHTPMSVENF